MLRENTDFNNREDSDSGRMEIESLGVKTSRKKKFEDRFIPSYVKKSFYDTFENDPLTGSDAKKNHFTSILKKSMFVDDSMFGNFENSKNKFNIPKKLLYFSQASKKKSHMRMIDFGFSAEKTAFETVCSYSRSVKKTPHKILDAPALQDDFYFDIVDWSASNYITIGLMNHVYTLNATTNKSFKLTSYYGENLISCIKSNQLGDSIAVGTTSGSIELFDFEKYTSIREIAGHSGRVGALSWKDNILASGSRDGHILLTDVRCKKDYQHKFTSHRQEICGLSFNCFDNMLASGGNDNKVIVWDIVKGTEALKMTEHTAAVKALAWSPHQNGLLASGGGSTDKTIKLWNVKLNKIEKSMDTGSQVCALRFSKSVNEMVSTHGFSQNQIEIWKTPEMIRVATLMGHTSRVLYLSMNPTGEEIVTASADETLRFWKVFPAIDGNGSKFSNGGMSFTKFMELR